MVIDAVLQTGIALGIGSGLAFGPWDMILWRAVGGIGVVPLLIEVASGFESGALDPLATELRLQLLLASEQIARLGLAAQPLRLVAMLVGDGGRRAAHFLAAGGHERIAHISGWQKSLNGRDRQAGFLAGLAENGLEPIDIIDSHYSRDIAAAAAGAQAAVVPSPS